MRPFPVRLSARLFVAGCLVWLLPHAALAQLGPDSLRFAVIADPQYADKANSGAETNTTSRCYRGSPVKMDSAVAFYNRVSPAFLLILGDYIDAYTAADSAKAVTDIKLMNSRLSKFQGDIYQVLGNHDQSSLNKSEWLEHSLGKVKKGYYSFDRGPFHFVVLDGNFTANGKDYGRVDPWTWTDTWIHKPQRDWLIADLDSAGDRPTIVSIHQNLHDAANESVRNADTIRALLETHGNVTHVFQGHLHAGAYKRVNGIHYVTFQAMVNCPTPAVGTGTANGNNYSLVTIRDTTLYIDGQVRSPKRTLPHAGLAKAKWTTSLAARRAQAPNPLEISGDRLKVNREGAHALSAHDLSGRLVAARSGVGVQEYALRDLAGNRARGQVLVFTVRTAAGAFTRKTIGF
jgi:UDP-2,3-diacylglucosamine pyrophosphatase LpxH